MSDKGDVPLYNDPNDMDRNNLIRQSDPLTLHQIITTTKFTDSDSKRLRNPQFVFGEVVEFEDTEGNELAP